MENESNFLDDKLYTRVMGKPLTTAQDFKDLLPDLYVICENHWQPRASVNSSEAEVKVLLKRTFTSWDVFMKRLKKEKYFMVAFLDKYSYKEILLSDPTVGPIAKSVLGN